MAVFLLDTNVIIDSYTKRVPPQFTAWLETIPDGRLCISLVTYIEVYSGAKSADELEFINDYLRNFTVIDCDLLEWRDKLIELRHNKSLKFADSIIALTAIENGFVLVTSDRRIEGAPGLRVLNPNNIKPSNS